MFFYKSEKTCFYVIYLQINVFNICGQVDAASAWGRELRFIPLISYTMNAHHAVESPTGTFIVSYLSYSKSTQISEFNTDGEVLRQFTGSLGVIPHLAVNSGGTVFAADARNHRILLLDAQLTLLRCIDRHQLNDTKPCRLCFREQSGQLLVAFMSSVMTTRVAEPARGHLSEDSTATSVTRGLEDPRTRRRRQDPLYDILLSLSDGR